MLVMVLKRGHVVALDAFGDVFYVREQRVLLYGQFVSGYEVLDEILVESFDLREEVIEDHLQLTHIHRGQNPPVELVRARRG